MAKNSIVSTCTITFKAFDYDTTLVNNKAVLWDFVAMKTDGKKHYAVLCALEYKKKKSIIKLAKKKLPEHYQLVVVCETVHPGEEEMAHNLGFKLLSVSQFRDFYKQIMTIRGENPDTTSKAEKFLNRVS